MENEDWIRSEITSRIWIYEEKWNLAVRQAMTKTQSSSERACIQRTVGRMARLEQRGCMGDINETCMYCGETWILGGESCFVLRGTGEI